jgi:hypothetical protein
MTTRVRSRRRRDRRVVLDAVDRWQLSYRPDPSDTRLRELYLAGREQLFAEARPGRLPLGFWEYEPGIPDELRVIPSRPAPMYVLEDRPPSPQYLEAEAAWQAGEDARSAWIEEHGPRDRRAYA